MEQLKKHEYSDKNLEEFIQKHFCVDFGIHEVISRDLPISYSAEAFIFRSKKGRIYVFISAEARLTLGDIQKLLSRMNLKPAHFFPPNGYQNYFLDYGRKQFLEVFPGREHVHDYELRFYKTRAPYNPALVEIAEIRDGKIKGFNSDAIGMWRTAIHLSYKRIIAKEK